MIQLLTHRPTGLASRRIGWLDANGDLVDARPVRADGIPSASLEVIALGTGSAGQFAARMVLFRGEGALYLVDPSSGGIVEATPDLGDDAQTEAFADLTRRSTATVMAGDFDADGVAVASLRPAGFGELFAKGASRLGRNLVGLFERSPVEKVEALALDLRSPDTAVAERAVGEYVELVLGSDEGRVAVRAKAIDDGLALDPDALRLIDGDLSAVRRLGAPTFVAAKTVDEALAGLSEIRSRSVFVRVEWAWFDASTKLDTDVERILQKVSADAIARGKTLHFEMLGRSDTQIDALAAAFPDAKTTIIEVSRQELLDSLTSKPLTASVDSLVVVPGPDAMYVTSELANVAVLNGFSSFVSGLHSPQLTSVYATARGAAAYRDLDTQLTATIGQLEAKPSLTAEERQKLISNRSLKTLFLDWAAPKLVTP